MTIRVILLVLFASPLAHGLISLSDVGDMISFAHEVVIDVLQTWKLVKPFVEGGGPQHIDLPIIKDKEKQILSRIALVTDNLTSLLLGKPLEGGGLQNIHLPIIKDKQQQILSSMALIIKKVDQVDKLVQSVTSASMLNLKQDIPSQIRLELRIDTLLDLISIMNFADHNFKQYTTVEDDNNTEYKVERHTLESFASFVVSHNPNSVQGVLDRLHFMIHPDPDQGHAFLHTGILEQIRHVLQVNR